MKKISILLPTLMLLTGISLAYSTQTGQTPDKVKTEKKTDKKPDKKKDVKKVPARKTVSKTSATKTSATNNNNVPANTK